VRKEARMDSATLRNVPREQLQRQSAGLPASVASKGGRRRNVVRWLVRAFAAEKNIIAEIYEK
jgi:hypothetical protein